MLAVLSGKALRVGKGETSRLVVELLRVHEIALVIGGGPGIEEFVNATRGLQVCAPRVRFLTMIVGSSDEIDVALVDELMGEGAVPVLAVPAKAVNVVANALMRRLGADRWLQLDPTGRTAAVVRQTAVSEPRSGWLGHERAPVGKHLGMVRSGAR